MTNHKTSVRLALYEEILDEENAIIAQNLVVQIENADLDDLRFALAPSIEVEDDARPSEV